MSVQRSEMFGTLIVIILLVASSCSQEPKDTIKDHIQRDFRKFTRKAHHLFDNIKGVFNNVFMGAIDRFEDRRKKIKNGLYRFIDESIYDKDITDKSLRSYQLDSRRIKSDASYMLTMHGFKVQTHTAITQDDYVINLQRILPDSGPIGNKVVLFLHGLLGSCEDWLILGPNKALPYLLLEAGYDVWLANARGTDYSNTHLRWLLDSPEYWNFSMQEIGLYDLPTAINYIRDTTEGKVKINFVGHSMGTTALLILLSMFPAYNNILNSATLLAPLAFMYHAKGPLRLLSEYKQLSSFSALGEKEFLRRGAFPQEVIELFCAGDERLCLNPLLLMANGGKRIHDKDLKESVLNHVPATGSTKTIIHYGQLLIKGQFAMYDNGPTINLLNYDSVLPPKYDLDRVTLPLFIFSAKNDWLSTAADVSTLIHHLPKPNPIVHHVVAKDDFSHTDFVWGEDAPDNVYDLVISILFKYNLIENYKDLASSK